MDAVDATIHATASPDSFVPVTRAQCEPGLSEENRAPVWNQPVLAFPEKHPLGCTAPGCSLSLTVDRSKHTVGLLEVIL